MILGLFLSALDIPIVPMSLMILSGLVLIGGIAFMIFRYVFEKGESDIDPAMFRKISDIAAWTFLIYAGIELIAAAACIVVNDACRNGYHYDLSKSDGSSHILCKFCSIFKDTDNRSFASDALTLGVYFDAFILNAFITNAIKIFREKLENVFKKN